MMKRSAGRRANSGAERGIEPWRKARTCRRKKRSRSRRRSRYLLAPLLLLSLEAIAKAYGTRPLFGELSFGLFEGDRAGLVGPNGSGKSTLLKILAGLEAPDRGTRSARGGIQLGYVAQDPELPSSLTVEEAVASSLAGVEDDARPARVAQALGRGGFPDGHAAVDAL